MVFGCSRCGEGPAGSVVVVVDDTDPEVTSHITISDWQA